MSQTHYYYALNREKAERALDLTWAEFVKRYRWRPLLNWQSLGEFLAFAVDEPRLSEPPTRKEMAALLSWTLRQTVARSSPQYYVLLCINDLLPRGKFVTADIDAERLEADCDALIRCALTAHARGDLDDRACWAVLTLHQPPEVFGTWTGASELFDSVTSTLAEALGAEAPSRRRSARAAAREAWRLPRVQARRLAALTRRFGSCRPLFAWQSQAAVEDNHCVLEEADTQRFTDFLQTAWKENWPVVEMPGAAPARFRHFRLCRRLWAASKRFPGNCLIHYYET